MISHKSIIPLIYKEHLQNQQEKGQESNWKKTAKNKNMTIQ